MAHLPFFRKGSIGVHANPSVQVYTSALLTEKFVAVCATLRIDATMVGSANATIDVTPQISNDSINWADTTPAFTQVTPGSTFPVTETKLISTVARFMRFRFTLADAGSGIVAATLSLLGDGKITSDETLDGEYLVYSPSVFRESLFIAVPPSPLLVPQLAGVGGGPIDVDTVIPVGQAGQTPPIASPTPGAGASAGSGYLNQYRPSGGRWNWISHQGRSWLVSPSGQIAPAPKQ